MKSIRCNTRATVTLVALCFVTVLGIVIASYIAVCSRAMNLSNRSFQAGLSQQLAEFGLEEGLRAFNKNDWTGWSINPSGMSGGTTAWTIDSTNKRASRTITLNANKLGQGATATVKIRIDNYDASTLGITYSSSTTYRANDLVGSSGIWYRYVNSTPASGNAPMLSPANPNLRYWIPAPIPSTWISGRSYEQYDVVNHSGTWYISAVNLNSSTPPTNWTQILPPLPTLYVNTSYPQGTYGFSSSQNRWFRATSNPTNIGSSWSGTGWVSVDTTFSWAYNSTKTYAFNDVVYYSGAWYRCIAGSSNNKTPTTAAAYWENALSGGMHAWTSGVNYNRGDNVYYSTTNQWYRCIKTHLSSGSINPSSSAPHWSNTPAYSTAWDSGKQYNTTDTVSYKGVWYLSRTFQSGHAPPTISPYYDNYWASTADTTRQWNPSTGYSSGTSFVSYGGVWYRCVISNTGQSPNNSTYWTPTWTNSANVTTGAPVIYAEASISRPSNPASRTQLRALLAPAALFPNAAGASANITVGGAGTVDSYDSSLGTSYAAQTPGFSAILAATDTSSTAVTLNGSTTISGYVATPSLGTTPFSPLFTYSTSAVVKGPSSSAAPKVDPTRVSRSPYVPKFDILPSGGLSDAFISANFPKGTQLALPSGTGNTLNIGTPGATAPSRYYYNSSLTISDTAAIRILSINGPVILYINGDLILDGDGSSPDGAIYINSTGSAEIHVAGALKVGQNSDGIRNLTSSTAPDPKKLIVLCDSVSNSTQYYGDGGYPFYGTLYIPNTNALDGLNFTNTSAPSAATYSIYGAISAKKITYDNSMNLHYDTSLRYETTPGVDQPYAVTEWRELPVAEQAKIP